MPIRGEGRLAGHDELLEKGGAVEEQLQNERETMRSVGASQEDS